MANFVCLNKESIEKLKEIIKFEIPIEYKSFEIEPFKAFNSVEFRLKKNLHQEKLRFALFYPLIAESHL